MPAIVWLLAGTILVAVVGGLRDVIELAGVIAILYGIVLAWSQLEES